MYEAPDLQLRVKNKLKVGNMINEYNSGWKMKTHYYKLPKLVFISLSDIAKMVWKVTESLQQLYNILSFLRSGIPLDV